MTTLKRLCSRLSLVLNWQILSVWARFMARFRSLRNQGLKMVFVFIIHLFGPGLKSGMKNMNFVPGQGFISGSILRTLVRKFPGVSP